jgi:hypothetical protein
MHLLRHVDHLEVGRERADEIARVLGASAPSRLLSSPCAGSLSRCAIASLRAASTGRTGLRRPARARVADELAEPVHVLAQRLVLLREEMLARTVRELDDIATGYSSAP